MKILLVAPRTNLLYSDAEVQRILRCGLDVTPVLGVVNYTDFLDEILRSSYDALWLCTHGTVTGVLLSDGELSASSLVPLVQGRFGLVVLNTCDSIATAQMLQNETSAEVIATISAVPDNVAFQTGALFALALAKSGDSLQAYNAARPGSNRSYVRLAGNQKKK